MSHPSIMKRSASILPVIAFTSLIALCVLLFNQSELLVPLMLLSRPVSETHPPPDLPQCGHALLLTAPRHGSTWLVDSIERCSFRANGTFTTANNNAELWIPSHVALSNISVAHATRHLQQNCSLKLFPQSFTTRPQDAVSMVRVARDTDTPILVLTRSIEAVFVSWRRARSEKVWNLVSAPNQMRNSTVDKELWNAFVPFRDGVIRYFSMVDDVLERLEVRKVDRFAYEDIANKRFVVARKNGCYIRNCNFM